MSNFLAFLISFLVIGPFAFIYFFLLKDVINESGVINMASVLFIAISLIWMGWQWIRGLTTFDNDIKKRCFRNIRAYVPKFFLILAAYIILTITTYF
jgi:hypothetical protein